MPYISASCTAHSLGDGPACAVPAHEQPRFVSGSEEISVGLANGEGRSLWELTTRRWETKADRVGLRRQCYLRFYSLHEPCHDLSGFAARGSAVPSHARNASHHRRSHRAPDRDTRRCAGTISSGDLLNGAQLLSAPLPRPFRTADRASSLCTPTVSNANASTSSAASLNTPVPQNGEPIAKPHSPVPNPGSISRIWKIPIAVSDSLQRHREARVGARCPLPECPGDELLEPFDRGWRRRG